MSGDWQQYQHHDELLRMQRAQEIIDASAIRPLTPDERVEIAVEVGLGQIYRKTIKEKNA